MKHKFLVPENIDDESARKLSRYAEVMKASQLGDSLDEKIPELSGLIVFSWPKILGAEQLRRMKSLRFVQSVLVGVNHIPLRDLPRKVIVCSNSGSYSTEVGEFAWGLILAASKKIVNFHNSIASGVEEIRSFTLTPNDVVILREKTLGIVGMGGIGTYVAKLGLSFGMNVIGLVRRKRTMRGTTLLTGEKGLERLLKESDVVLLSIPLTKSTKGIIGSRELLMMKRDAILVNVARGDLVQQESLYTHLVSNPSFKYATDVWWYNETGETLKTKFPFASLPNFIGTPHVSGPSAVVTGRPMKQAVENVIRYLRGEKPAGIIDRSDYV